MLLLNNYIKRINFNKKKILPIFINNVSYTSITLEHEISSIQKEKPGSNINAHYDLVVIGSGPSAQKCAIDSAKRGKSVALIDKNAMHGGVCVHTGTIPSKTFREAILHLTGYRHQGFYGKAYHPFQKPIAIQDILARVKKVEEGETDVVRDQMRRNGIHFVNGTARFIDSDEKTGFSRIAVLKTERKDINSFSSERHVRANLTKMILSGEKVLVACGTRPLRPPGIPFDGVRVFDSDQILWGNVRGMPKQLIVVGAGVIGMEYASMINIIPGSDCTIIDPRTSLLDFADTEVAEALQYHMRMEGARFLFGERVIKVEVLPNKSVVAYLESGKRILGDALLYTMGRQGNTDSLNLDAVDLEADARGLLQVNDFYQTTNPNIYATGDCIGYPALASTSMEQGKRASCHMWEQTLDYLEEFKNHREDDHSAVHSVFKDGVLGRETEELFPYGIYTIPEISMVGKSEKQLTKEKIPYEVGIANFNELAKGQMLGGLSGFLKIIFHADTLKILGVHCFGEGATEIVHIGQVVLAQGGDMRTFANIVFNYPTMAEAYNVAAFDGLSRIGSINITEMRKDISHISIIQDTKIEDKERKKINEETIQKMNEAKTLDPDTLNVNELSKENKQDKDKKDKDKKKKSSKK